MPNIAAFIAGPAAMMTRRFQRKPRAFADPLATCPPSGRSQIST
jgi:hypothetical protein